MGGMAKNPKWVQRTPKGWRGWAYVTNPLGGKKRVYGEVQRTPEEAHLDAVKMRRRYSQPIDPQHLSFGAACLAVGDEIHRNRSRGYHTWWQCQKRALELHFPATRMLDKITPESIDAFIQKRQSQKVSASTINHHLRALSLVFKWARRQRVIDSDPLEHVVRPRVERRPMDWFEMSELGGLLEKARPYDAAIAKLLALTGLRRSELIRLQWRDVNHDSIWVRGKVRGESLPLSKDARACLAALRNGVIEPGEPVIPSPENAIRSAFRRLKAIDSRFHPHALRHTFATALVRAGHPMDVVQRLMRVSSPAMVMRYYHHDDRHRSAIEGLSI